MESIKYNSTSNKLLDSRIIKFALIGILSLLILKGANLWLYHWITTIILSGGFEQVNVSEGVLLKILGIIDVGIAGGITTIVTAVIARYGLRESTSNIGAGLAQNKASAPDKPVDNESAM